MNEQQGVRPTERMTYRDSTYSIVSKVAYLIGVPKRIFENQHEPPQLEIFQQLENDKNARIIRHLCIIRTAIERNFKYINDKMRTEYKRDMNHNYLILTGDERIDTDSYQVRMIVANAVPDLLQCRIQGIDGKFMVYYDITSRHSMTALFEEKKMDLESLQVILGGFIQIMEEMSEYLLNPCQLILEPEYIYLDAERKSVRFCYLPGFHGEIQKQFQSLAEYILPKLDHEDGKAVMLGYNVYRRALEDSFHLEYIKEELYKICNSDEEDFSLYEKKKTVLQEENRMTEEEKAEDLWQVEGWERASVSGNEKQKKSSADSQKRKTNKIWKPVAGFGAALVILLGITAGMAGGYIPRISKEIFLLGILAAMILGMLSYSLWKKEKTGYAGA